jgi:hypothetical protein
LAGSSENGAKQSCEKSVKRGGYERKVMKSIQHAVFAESTVIPVWSWGAAARRERSRERIRQRVEAFINEIGVESVVSVSEHAPTFGLFSIVVWWYRDAPDTETPVIRPSGESANV